MVGKESVDVQVEGLRQRISNGSGNRIPSRSPARVAAAEEKLCDVGRPIRDR